MVSHYIFDENGKEIVKRTGYIAPDKMIALLKSIIADPSAEKN
ncbi:MAG: hypothetical protein Q9M36_07120 [Sulfurovum sp.]|nr:hypothetical protein [Sulfurovum sp.]